MDSSLASLGRITESWWLAAFQRDSLFFEDLLAPEFTWRRMDNPNYDYDRLGFFQNFQHQFVCADFYTIRIQDSYRVGDIAWVQSAGTSWVGEWPHLAQAEHEVSLVYRRQAERWRLLRLRWVGYYWPPQTQLPDTTLFKAIPAFPFNPVVPPHRISAQCPPNRETWSHPPAPRE